MLIVAASLTLAGYAAPKSGSAHDPPVLRPDGARKRPRPSPINTEIMDALPRNLLELLPASLRL